MKRKVTLGLIVLVLMATQGDKSQRTNRMNRLKDEKSPYLLQHADNPVDWYPWGEEAFETARKNDKPIFLSIGYSTCHWCHVMEHESFEDSAVAALMNEYFVSIKVDREERPDIDNIYMTVCQMMTGGGGWPLTILMTPDEEPFFAGTYFPKKSYVNRIGMMQLIPRVGEMWKNERDKLTNSAAEVVQRLQSSQNPLGTELLDEEVLKEAYTQFLQRFDDKYGGFKGRMKFPTAHNLTFLLRYWKRTDDPGALHMVERTLQEMRKGGIYDHVGLGFHRYSTDSQWFVPHFEKMLYDQAMNAMAYLEVYHATKKEEYARTAREIFTYVLRDMTSENGGFYSAEDADSEGEEGKFYLWTTEEIKKAIGEEDGQFFMDMYNITPGGNFRDEASGQKTGRNIPRLKASPAELAHRFGLSEEALLNKVERLRKRLFNAREKRIHPQKDDKILTDWNGLMISALSKGAQILGEGQYAEAAMKAAEFVMEKLRMPNGHLIKRYRDGVASHPAHVEDYAFMVWGLLDLYEATFEVRYLREAIDLTNIMIDLFWDEENGGFFFTADDGEKLIVRTKEIYDGAIPSGNSVAASNLLRIGRITGKPKLEDKARLIGKVFSSQVKSSPSGYSQLLSAVDFGLGPSYEIVVVGNPTSKDTQKMLRATQKKYVPNKVVLLKSTENASSGIVDLAPFTETQVAIDGKATAYVCQNYACEAPTTDPDDMLTSLK